jgi:hypothetical protein
MAILVLLPLSASGCRHISQLFGGGDGSDEERIAQAIRIQVTFDELDERGYFSNQWPQKLSGDKATAMSGIEFKVDRLVSEKLKIVMARKELPPGRIKEILEKGVLVNPQGKKLALEELDGDAMVALEDNLTQGVPIKVDEISANIPIYASNKGKQDWFMFRGSSVRGYYDWRSAEFRTFLTEIGPNLDGVQYYEEIGFQTLDEMNKNFGLQGAFIFPQSYAWKKVKNFARASRYVSLSVRYDESLRDFAQKVALSKQIEADPFVPDVIKEELRDAIDGVRISKEHEQLATVFDRIAGIALRDASKFLLLPDGRFLGADASLAFMEYPADLGLVGVPILSSVASRLKELTMSAIVNSGKQTGLSLTALIWAMVRLDMVKSNPQILDKASDSERDVAKAYYTNPELRKSIIKELGQNYDDVFLSGEKARDLLKTIFPNRTRDYEYKDDIEDISLGAFEAKIDHARLTLTFKKTGEIQDLGQEYRTALRNNEVSDFQVVEIEKRGDRPDFYTLISKDQGWIYVKKDGSYVTYFPPAALAKLSSSNLRAALPMFAID